MSGDKKSAHTVEAMVRKTFDTECLEIFDAAACQKPLSNAIVSLSRSLTSPRDF